MIMNEVAPLVDAQVGAFFLADAPEVDPTAPARTAGRLVMCAGYAVVPGRLRGRRAAGVPARRGPGRAGRRATGSRMLVDDVPAGYLPIRSGAGRDPAARGGRAAGPVRGPGARRHRVRRGDPVLASCT